MLTHQLALNQEGNWTCIGLGAMDQTFWFPHIAKQPMFLFLLLSLTLWLTRCLIDDKSPRGAKWTPISKMTRSRQVSSKKADICSGHP